MKKMKKINMLKKVVNWEVWRGCRGGGVHVKKYNIQIPIKLTENPIFLLYFCCCSYIFLVIVCWTD